MKTTAYWCFICAAALAVAALWLYNGEKAHADTMTYIYAGTATDTEVRATILDNSKYPDILAKLECSGTDIQDMINSCAAKLKTLCPDGGNIKELGETPVGVLPAQIMIVVECRHEPGA